MNVARASVDNLARDLVRLLNEMVGIHGELAMHMRSKLDAIKRADPDRIQSITAREAVLVRKAAERENLRRLITQRILGELGLDGGKTGKTRLTEFAECLDEPRRSQVLVAAAGLRDRLQEIERTRAITTLISQEMLKHMREVLAVMTGGSERAELYSRSGRRQQGAAAAVFEAVG